MIKKLIRDMKKKSIYKILIAFMVIILLIWVGISGEFNLAYIVMSSLFSIGCLIYIIIGIAGLIETGTEVIEYCQKAGITTNELDEEFKSCRDLNGVYFGKRHMMFLSDYSICVHLIENMEYIKLVRVKTKNAHYFRLYFKSTEVENETDKYFAVSSSAKEVFEEIEDRNPNVKLIFD